MIGIYPLKNKNSRYNPPPEAMMDQNNGGQQAPATNGEGVAADTSIAVASSA